MHVEYTVISAPLYIGGPSEDAVLVTPAGGGRPFFAVVVDGHGNETDVIGHWKNKSYVIATFAGDVAVGLNVLFQQYPDPSCFPDQFDEVAQVLGSVYLPRIAEINKNRFLTVGAVATAIVVEETQIRLAQTGDCRLYVSLPRWNRGFACLTQDHNVDHPDEIARLRSFLRSGQFNVFPNPSGNGLPPLPPGSVDRLYRSVNGRWVGGLEPTRTFGNWDYHPAVIHTPSCSTIQLAEFARGELFALCSDGGNRIVESTLRHFQGRTQTVSLSEVHDYARSLLPQATDDVTIVFFRQTS
ncbi:protein phosphatase 2C family protein [Candidatus Uhrbacteria bacterium]|nr:protein phosphatase 2C family protein [Candidatus Uhrbacteria bacterium]